ncbi:hypothetical protein ABZ456_18990 [Streptomyces sp. NPDC005776]|uniref:hypothetical protein n=1 Tax=Streptomyces sp. NPDC005776 TaxID=3154676 RepID=UPI0033DD17A7
MLNVLDRLPERGGPLPQTDEQTYEELVTRLRTYWARAIERYDDPRREPGAAEECARSLHGQPGRLPATPAVPKAAR